jgi:hypothetical protein
MEQLVRPQAIFITHSISESAWNPLPAVEVGEAVKVHANIRPVPIATSRILSGRRAHRIMSSELGSAHSEWTVPAASRNSVRLSEVLSSVYTSSYCGSVYRQSSTCL